jgi:predicted patatin/cPLA2 family phospholipase
MNIESGKRKISAETIYNPERDGVMEHEGDISVLSAIMEQAKAVREGRKNNETRVVLYILPGVLRGVYGGGQVTAMHDAGLTNGIKAVVGISTGAPAGAYLLAGNPRVGTKIYSEECISKDFLNMKKLPDGYAMDVQFLSEVYRGEVSDKPLDVEKIKNSRPDFLVGVTAYKTGKGRLLDAKKIPTIEAVQASCAAPILYRTPPL